MTFMKSTKTLPKKQKQWFTMDIHLHTPASMDFQQPEISYLDILKKAESRNLDIISFTDHNTIAGYRKLREDIEALELLEKLNRLLPEEKNHLLEYRNLLKLRYLVYKSWFEISIIMNCRVSEVHILHLKALQSIRYNIVLV